MDKEQINIYCMADLGTYEPSVKKLAKKIVEDSKGIPSLLAIIGDNFYDRGVKDSEDTAWEDFESIFKNYPLPIYAVLGNHDYLGNIHGQVKNKRWHMEHYYYYVESEDTGLWFVDTQILAPEEDGGEYHDMRDHITKQIGPWEEEKKKHWKWLEDSLEENKTKQYKFVFGHFPIISQGAYSGREGMEPLLDLMEKYNITAYVSGHDHNSQHTKYYHHDNFWIHQLVCGASIRHGTYEDDHSEDKIGVRRRIYKGFFTDKISFLKININYELERVRFIFSGEKGEEYYSYDISYSFKRPSPIYET